MQTTFHVHGGMRLVCGIICIVAASAMVMSGYDLGWGLSYSVIVPACMLMFPGLALCKRKVLRLRVEDVEGIAAEEVRVELETGWLWRHGRSLCLNDCALELLPMAGLWAVIVHREGHEYPLLTWLRKTQAEAVLTFLDQAAPTGAWERRTRKQAQWDK